MATFNKKLQGFLDFAVEKNVIGSQVSSDLKNLASSGEYEHKGWLSLSSALGGLGALILGFGLILIIASNWYMFSDTTKLAGFLVLLGGTHAGGLYLNNKGYPKTAVTLHFLGAGLFIAGIGLISQIFHLRSETGISFLIWAIAIIPLAVVLKSGAISLLSCLALWIWANTAIDHYLTYVSQGEMMTMFNLSFAAALMMIGFTLKEHDKSVGAFLQIPGMIGIIIASYLMGFFHRAGEFEFNLHPTILFAIVPLVLSVILLVYQTIKYKDKKEILFFLGTIGLFILTVITIGVIGTIETEGKNYFTLFSFGHNRRIYLGNMFVNIMAWVTYFAIAFWGVVFGALKHQRWMLNSNVALVGLGVFTRFLDLMGSMMNTGVMFVVSGLMLFVIGFAMEKWRRLIIEKANTEWKGIE